MFAILYGNLCWSKSCLVLVLITLYVYKGAGQETGQTLWGRWLIHAICAVNAFLGVGSLGGEVLDLSVPRSPKAALQRSGAAHGPLPPPRVLLKVVLSLFCCFSEAAACDLFERSVALGSSVRFG